MKKTINIAFFCLFIFSTHLYAEDYPDLETSGIASNPERYKNSFILYPGFEYHYKPSEGNYFALYPGFAYSRALTDYIGIEGYIGNKKVFTSYNPDTNTDFHFSGFGVSFSYYFGGFCSNSFFVTAGNYNSYEFEEILRSVFSSGIGGQHVFGDRYLFKYTLWGSYVLYENEKNVEDEGRFNFGFCLGLGIFF